MTRRKRQKLRSGFTTGTAAAAAVKAALTCILSGRAPHRVTVRLLTGDDLSIAVHRCRRIDDRTAQCSVIKDAGDDPDVTHKAEIGARVAWQPGSQTRNVDITGGTGVGRVTKPGLEVPPGQPAINAGPRTMIRRSAIDVMTEFECFGTASAQIFVPRGEELARQTLNARLGIVGGISILGTTGVVRPMSHDAYVATIRAGLSVTRASGLDRVVLTTGRRSERMAQARWPELPAEGFVQIGDYFGRSLEMASELEFQQVVLAVFFGKAVKMAQGLAHTHARSARLTLESVARWAVDAGAGEDLARTIAGANTARQAFDLIKDDWPQVIEAVGRRVVRSAEGFGQRAMSIQAVIFGFDGAVRFDSAAT